MTALAAPAPAGALRLALSAIDSPEGDFIPGTSKPAVRTVRGRRFHRQPVKSRLVVAGDDLAVLVDKLTSGRRQASDTIVLSEKAVATSQGRALRETDIVPGPLARLLWRFVRKVPYGIGLRSPATMQCAINECGRVRILAAAVAGAVGKLFGRRGDFYRVAGMQAATIDAASTCPIPELSGCVVLGPKDPEGVAQRLAEALGCGVAIVDVNDIGGSWVLGASAGVDSKLIEDAMRDNPLGQGAEMTPFGIIRELKV
jgi:F420-0:gamma-glutamyl ligase